MKKKVYMHLDFLVKAELMHLKNTQNRKNFKTDILVCEMSLIKLQENVATNILLYMQTFHPIHFSCFLMTRMGEEGKDGDNVLMHVSY